jgi:hypothetical protein
LIRILLSWWIHQWQQTRSYAEHIFRMSSRNFRKSDDPFFDDLASIELMSVAFTINCESSVNEIGFVYLTHSQILFLFKNISIISYSCIIVPLTFLFHVLCSNRHSYFSSYDSRFFLKCPIGKQIWLLLNRIFLSLANICTCIMKFYYVQHDYHLRARKRENDLKSSRQEKKENRKRYECSFFKHFIVLFA